jgi:hypothetical protein
MQLCLLEEILVHATMQTMTCPSIDASFQSAASGAPQLANSSADMYMAALAFDALLLSRILQPILPLSRATAINDIMSIKFHGASGPVAWTPSDLSICRNTLNSTVTVFARGQKAVRLEPAATVTFEEMGTRLSSAPGAAIIRWPDGTIYPPNIATQTSALPSLSSRELSPTAVLIISGLTSVLAVLMICIAVAVCLALHARSRPAPKQSKPCSLHSNRTTQGATCSQGASTDRNFGVAYLERIYGAGAQEPQRSPARRSSVIDNVAAWLRRNPSHLGKEISVRGADGSHTGSGPPELWLSGRQGSSQHMRRSKGSLRKRATALFGLSTGGTNSTPRQSNRSFPDAARISLEVA